MDQHGSAWITCILWIGGMNHLWVFTFDPDLILGDCLMGALTFVFRWFMLPFMQITLHIVPFL